MTNLLSRLSLIGLGGLVVAWAASAASAAPLKTDTAKSSVTIVAKQMGVPVEAKFSRFDAAVDFDGKKPAAAKATVTIDIASFDLGDKMYNDEVLKKEWFNAAQFPKATFVASSFKPAGAGKFDVTGTLTIKGKTSHVAFPMTVAQSGNTQTFTGALPIKRLAYNIGEGDWKDTSMVADDVTIRFNIATHP